MHHLRPHQLHLHFRTAVLQRTVLILNLNVPLHDPIHLLPQPILDLARLARHNTLQLRDLHLQRLILVRELLVLNFDAHKLRGYFHMLGVGSL